MKNQLQKYYLEILFLFILNIPFSFGQWETNGPYGGVINALAKSGSNLFAGTGNGVFISSDAGQNWNAANMGIQRKTVTTFAVNGSTIFAGINESGVYLSANNGNTWTAKNTGLTNFNITKLFSASTGIFAATADGVFFSSNNGNNWSIANTGIPNTYAIYSFAEMGDTVFAGSYGLGLYMSANNGNTWTNVAGGFPSNTFVYALITNGSTIYAGTSAGIIKSINRGLNWTTSNTGFPSGMWAKSFTLKPSSIFPETIFAGTYSEGIFASTNNGSSWTPVNNGLPDQPFPTGLPHNYPSVDDLLVSGINVLAATVNGTYRTPNNGSYWSESNEGLNTNDITAITSNNSTIIAGSDRTGVYTSTDNGTSWTRSNNGLTSINILAFTSKNTSIFVSTLNENVFRSNNNGSTWISANTGLTSDAFILKADDQRVLAITSGAQYTPPGLFHTIDDGVNWTEIPTGFPNGMTALASNTTTIYVGTYSGKVYSTNDLGLNWLTLSSNLPSVKINSILVSGSNLFVGTEGNGIYKSSNNGTSWTAANNGISNNLVTEVLEKNGVIYATTWGGGIFTSNNNGSSWSAYNTVLTNLFVRNITSDAGRLYAGTNAGAYSTTLATGFEVFTERPSLNLYPNPSSGLIYFSVPFNQKIIITVNDLNGKIVYHFEGYSSGNKSIDLSNISRGIYLLSINTEKEQLNKKIIIK